jgi:hypothetical protein
VHTLHVRWKAIFRKIGLKYHYLALCVY